MGVTKYTTHKEDNNENENENKKDDNEYTYIDLSENDELYPNTIIHKVDHFAIMVPNVTQSRVWYNKYFGLIHPTCQPSKLGCNYIINDMGVKISVLQLPSNVPWVPPSLNGYHLAHYALKVRISDYIPLRQKLIDGGVDIQGEHHYPDTSQSIYFADLNGYVWEVTCYTEEDLSILT